MKSSKKKPFEPEVFIENINKKILIKQAHPSISTTASASNTNKYGLSHKKINSANNHYSKLKQSNKYHLPNPYRMQRTPTTKAPQINTRYKHQLDKLNTSISNLKNKYSDLIQQFFINSSTIHDYKMKFIKARIKNGKEEKNKRDQNFQKERIKKAEENAEKKMKWKEEFETKKDKELKKIKNKVKKLRVKNEIERKNYIDSINKSKQKKTKIMKEEKIYIQERIYNQIKNDSKEREKKKKIVEEKMIKDAEIKQGQQKIELLKMKDDIENKIKELNTINSKMEREIGTKVNKKVKGKIFTKLNIPFEC